MEVWQLTAVLILSLFATLVTGLPICFCLGGISVIACYFILGGTAGLSLVATTALSETTNFILVAVPLFILMANVLEFSGVADDLYGVLYRWMGGLRGGLAMGTVIICAIFAAMAGISSVATVTMGLIALPSMLKRDYDKTMALGCISAGGALGILIPPSVVMIIYACLAEQSVGGLFMGGMIPGIILAVLFCIYIAIRCGLNPKIGPPLPVEERCSWREKFVSLRSIVLPVILIVGVLGTIYTGVSTPTEAAGIGAAGAIVCAAIYRRLSLGNIKQALLRTTRLTGMVLWIMVGGILFSQMVSLARVSDLILSVFLSVEVNRWLILIAMQFIFFIFGMFLDPVGIMMIFCPIFTPIVEALGFDLLWFGVLFTINMEMAYITPPFGFNLFIMKGIVPPGITMGDIYKSIWPFVALQMVCLAVCMLWPDLILWLPSKMIG